MANAVVVSVHAPLESAVAVPTCVEPSNTFTVLLAAAVPVSVGVRSLVIWSPTTPLSVENEAIVGAEGAEVGAAILTATDADAAPVLPAASVAVAVKLWLPVDNAAVV